MRKYLSSLLCIAVMFFVVGCSISDASPAESSPTSNYIYIPEQTTTRRTTTTAATTSIPQVEDGIDLDDVESLVKEAINKNEMRYEYKTAYYKITDEVDNFLSHISNGTAIEYDISVLLKKYKDACDAGIDYLDSCIEVDAMFSLLKTDGLTRSEKDVLRSYLTVFKRSKAAIETSRSDMTALLTPIIEEARLLSEDEIDKIYDIYQVLIDKIDTADTLY